MQLLVESVRWQLAFVSQPLLVLALRIKLVVTSSCLKTIYVQFKDSYFKIERLNDAPWDEKKFPSCIKHKESDVGVNEVFYAILWSSQPSSWTCLVGPRADIWLFSWLYHPLQGQVVPLGAVSKPGSDAACQDALYGAGIESI